MATLTLGAFSMIDPDGSALVMADGTSWGEPVPIEVAINTFLQDGAIVVTQGHDNREVTVRVRFFGADLTALGVKEAALISELEKPNTLTWTPAVGPLTVFDVITSSLAQDDESFVGEVQSRPWRTYSVRLVCAAFTRSATETVTAALPATGTTTTLLDACSAATGWTGTINGVSATVTNASGLNTVSQASPTNTSYVFTQQKTFAATTTSTKLLKVDWKASAAGGVLSAAGDGTTLQLVAEGPSSVAGEVTSWFYVAASALAVTKFTYSYSSGLEIPTGPSLSFSIDNVAVTDVQPTYGTGRQQLRSLTLVGSARTTGSIAVESSSSSLGTALVYTYPADSTTNGYVPSLRQFRTSGNTVTADSTMVSGSRENISGSGITFQEGLNLLPRGVYVLVARMATTGIENGTVTYTTSTLLGSNIVGATATTTPSISINSAYSMYVLGRISLPTVDVDRFTPAKLQIQIQGSYTNVVLDEAWLYNTTIGQLTWVDCGTGTAAVGGPAKRLFLESASVVTPRPTLRVGHSADRSDAYFPVGLVKSWEMPKLTPLSLNIHTVTTNATDAVVTARYRAAWHTNPAA